MTTRSQIPIHSRQRLEAIDGLRGTAALCVAIFHDQPFFSDKPFFDWGWINVDLFFLLSGIVMMHVYEKRIMEGSTSFTEFLSHRIARLWPVHVFAMLVMLILDIVFHYGIKHGHPMDWNAPLYTFLLNLVFLQNIGLYGLPTWDGNAWSLTPEIAANLVWFYLVVRRKLSSKLLVLIVLSCAIIQANVCGSVLGLILNSYLVRCFISFALGCLLYRHFIANPALSPPSRNWSNVAGLGLVAVILLIILNLAMWHLRLFNHWDWILVLFVFPALTYFALQPQTVLNRVLSSRLFVFLGAISYSVYLLHVQVAIVIRDVGVCLNRQFLPPVEGVLYLLLTIGCATLAFRYIEVPARKALRDNLEPALRKIFFDPH